MDASFAFPLEHISISYLPPRKMKINRQIFGVGLLGVGLCVSSCASTEQTYWERGKKGTIIVHHIRKVNGGSRDRTERLTSTAIRPAEIHAYDLGRLPDGNGGMHEAHEYYRVVQSETFDLRLPAEGSVRVSRGPKTVLTPPTYSPPPQSQRINDAVADAMEAKRKLDEARQKIDEQLALEVSEQNQRLQDQVNNALAMGKAAPAASPSPASAAAQAGAQAGSQATDPLAQWGQKVGAQP
jgi:hypothetical protein